MAFEPTNPIDIEQADDDATAVPADEEAEKAVASRSETHTMVRQGKTGRLPREKRRGVPEKDDA